MSCATRSGKPSSSRLHRPERGPQSPVRRQLHQRPKGADRRRKVATQIVSAARLEAAKAEAAAVGALAPRPINARPVPPLPKPPRAGAPRVLADRRSTPPRAEEAAVEAEAETTVPLALPLPLPAHPGPRRAPVDR